MEKDNWIVSYAKLAHEHFWGGMINTVLACMGFCYIVNFVSEEVLQGTAVLGGFYTQLICICIFTAVHTVFVPKLAGAK